MPRCCKDSDCDPRRLLRAQSTWCTVLRKRVSRVRITPGALCVRSADAETLVEGSLAAIDIGRSDTLLTDPFEASALGDLPGLLINPRRAPHVVRLGI